MKGLIKAVVLLCGFFPLAGVHAASFDVGFYNYPPMMIEQDKTGIYQDIFDELGKLTGDTFNVQYYPFRALAYCLMAGSWISSRVFIRAGCRGSRHLGYFRYRLARSSMSWCLPQARPSRWRGLRICAVSHLG